MGEGRGELKRGFLISGATMTFLWSYAGIWRMVRHV
jgi:hypothetical protein